MKVRRQLAALEPMVLGPLHGLKDDHWYQAPPGKWTISQIVAHLALGVDLSSTVLEQRGEKKGMKRRSTPGQSILRHMLLQFGRFPRGRKSPDGTVPPEKPDHEQVAAQFRMGVERFHTLVETWPEKRQIEVFVRHPVVGDLNVPEWVRFHFVHGRHHARQIGDRLQWMGHGREGGRGKREE